MLVEPREFRFRDVGVADLPMLHEWLSRPHVAEWWGEPGSLADLTDTFTPALTGSPAHRAYVYCVNGRDAGFIQWYIATAFHDKGWWRDEHDPGVRGIDQYLADAGLLGAGIGTLMVRTFVDWLFEDPAFEKAGFRASGEVDTPDGRALLMYCERA